MILQVLESNTRYAKNSGVQAGVTMGMSRLRLGLRIQGQASAASIRTKSCLLDQSNFPQNSFLPRHPRFKFQHSLLYPLCEHRLCEISTSCVYENTINILSNYLNLAINFIFWTCVFGWFLLSDLTFISFRRYLLDWRMSEWWKYVGCRWIWWASEDIW